jgi:hypothetical protein
MIWTADGASTRCVVPPNITGIALVQELVVGTVASEPRSDLGPTKCAGFFVLDTRDESLSLGLTKREWLGQLGKLGIEREPTLRTPITLRILKELHLK